MREPFGPLRRGFVVIGVLSALISLLMLTGSLYMLQVYDRVLTSGSVPTLAVLFAIVVGLYGFLTFYDALRMRMLSRLGLWLDQALAGAGFRAGLAADLRAQRGGDGGLGGGRAGDGGAALRDLATLRGVIAGPVMLALFDLPFTLVFLVTLFVIHPLLGVLTIGGMVVAGILALINRRILARHMPQAHIWEQKERQLAESARQSAPTLVALGMAGTVGARWLGLHQHALAAGQRGSEPSEILAACSRGFRMLLQSGLLTMGALLVIEGQLSAGSIVASSILSGRALAPVDQLIGQWRAVAAAQAAWRRMREFLAPGAEAAAGVKLPAPSGVIEVTGLRYLRPQSMRLQNMRDLSGPAALGEGGAPPPKAILEDLSFSLEPGAGIGIIGGSASGKSTLARLLVGALRPDGGEIRFDGATLDQWDPDRLGRSIGYLPQRVDLLPGSVRDNIARFDPEARDEEVMAAAMAAGVHEMILRLPEGYGTELGQSDLPLSGGQIQRIGLARALYGQPRIVILDEPNAHLDVAGEAALARAITALRAKGASVIVMAHRAGALAAISRILVLQDGRIQQDGPRDEVLAMLRGRYTAPEAAPQRPPRDRNRPVPAALGSVGPSVLSNGGPSVGPSIGQGAGEKAQ